MSMTSKSDLRALIRDYQVDPGPKAARALGEAFLHEELERMAKDLTDETGGHDVSEMVVHRGPAGEVVGWHSPIRESGSIRCSLCESSFAESGPDGKAPPR